MRLSICSPSFSSILLALSLLLLVSSLFCEQQHNLVLASADAASGNPEAPSGTSPRGQRGLQTGENNTFEHTYDVECFLCRGPRDNTRILRNIHQGSIVTLCVQLADESLREDGSVLIQSIRDFTWIKQNRAAPPSSSASSSASILAAEEIRISSNHTVPSRFTNSTAEVIDWKLATATERQQGYNLFGNHARNNNTNSSHSIETGDDDLVVVATQEAIKDGSPTNPLTTYHGCFGEGGSDEPSDGDSNDNNDDASGAGGTFCSLTSVLKADFYSAIGGTVVGNGIVSLGFGTGGTREVAFRTGTGF